MSNYCELAQQIVRNTSSNINKDSSFHTTSFIYKKTNEQLEELNKFLKNHKRILSVIGSGDQILNSMITKPDRIDAFDISIFPQFFLKLKLAAIEGLTKEEYLSFFFDTIHPSNDEYYDDLYFDKIRPYLDKEAEEFWSYLFEFNDWYDIYNSTLFSSEPVILKRALEQNEYLDDDNYIKLKSIIPNVKINYFVDNLLDMNIRSDYDLIYLSNIVQYVDVHKYIDRINKLTESGKTEVITYIFGEVSDIVHYFDNTVGVEFNGNGILIHK